MHEAIDQGLSDAVLAIAAELFPDGFDASETAPSTFEELCAHLDQGRRMLVYSGASDATIWGAPHVNHAFRAWHDWVHYQFKLPFTPEGEHRACGIQCFMLHDKYGNTPRVAHWRNVLTAEIDGQLQYAQRHCGAFPVDQRRFVLAYLAEPSAAITGDF